MAKVSKGTWEVAPNTSVDWAVETFKADSLEDSLRVVSSTKAINFCGDTLNCPTLTTTVTSPMDGVVQLETHHWKGQAYERAGPRFELFPNGCPARSGSLSFEKSDVALTMKSQFIRSGFMGTDSLTAEIDTQPNSFNIKFVGGGRLLTALGWRSVGYVKRGVNLHANVGMGDPDRGERWMTYQLQLGVGEKVYGLGERFGPFIKNGQTVDLWNEDGGASSEMAYKNIPFYLTSNNYGIFIPTPSLVSYEIQSERTARVNITVPGESISMMLIYGSTPKEIIHTYGVITGMPALVPAWTMGLWLTTSPPTNNDKDTVDHLLDGMEGREIPLSVFHFDCFWMKGFQWCDFEFDAGIFPDAKAQIAAMKEKRGLKICVWISPYIGQESKLFAVGLEKGYFIKKANGSVWQWDKWQAGMGLVDFTNPEACSWYSSELEKLIDLGVDCFKTDFGGRIPTSNAHYFDDSDPQKMHNYYPFLYNKVTFETLERRLGRGKAVLFARSATAGGQRFPVHWGGHPISTFEAMAETLRGGLSLGLCGFGFWAHDIGGFEGKPDSALFKRWIQFGCLSSHTRLHGSSSHRVPWTIDPSDEAATVLKQFVSLKHRLMPYIYHAAIEAHTTAIPVMRATFLEFPRDPAAWFPDTQYMLGENLLVAPIFNAEGTVRYYVPQVLTEQEQRKEDKDGNDAAAEDRPPRFWVGLLDGKWRRAGRYHFETHDAFSLPLLIRPGSAVVLGKKNETPLYDWADDVEIYLNFDRAFDAVVAIPDWKAPGESRAILSFEREDKTLNVRVTRVNGELEGHLTLLIAGATVTGGTTMLPSGSVKLDAETVNGSFPGWRGFRIKAVPGFSNATLQLGH